MQWSGHYRSSHSSPSHHHSSSSHRCQGIFALRKSRSNKISSRQQIVAAIALRSNSICLAGRSSQQSVHAATTSISPVDHPSNQFTQQQHSSRQQIVAGIALRSNSIRLASKSSQESLYAATSFVSPVDNRSNQFLQQQLYLANRSS